VITLHISRATARRNGIHALTIHVREFSPMKESRSTCVSLLARNGKWAPRLPSARIHS